MDDSSTKQEKPEVPDNGATVKLTSEELRAILLGSLTLDAVSKTGWIFVISMLVLILLSTVGETELTYRQLYAAVCGGFAWSYGWFISKYVRICNAPSWHMLVWFFPFIFSFALYNIVLSFGIDSMPAETMFFMVCIVLLLRIKDVWNIMFDVKSFFGRIFK